jgi:hypothetical protein
MAKMARASSATVLTEERNHAGNSYRAQVVFAFRLFELRPTNRDAAEALLKMIPQGDEQQAVLMTLGDSLCDSEDVADMRALGRVRDALPRDLSRAVLLASQRMPAYVAYSLIATLDPHSDFAIQMQKPCARAHSEFMKAVAVLPPERREWLIGHVFDPDRCRSLANPEAQ